MSGPSPVAIPLAILFLTLSAAPALGQAALAEGAEVMAVVNVQPQELRAADGAPDPRTGSFPHQRLVSVSTYDCATGQPSGTTSARYSLDAVLVLTHPLLGAGIDAGLASDLLADPTGLNPRRVEEPPEQTRYGASLALGFGALPPASLLPGTASFVAFLYCGGTPTGLLPATTGRQTPGLFGWHDELSWSAGGTAKGHGPEFTFTYRTAERHAGTTASPVFTPAFYMNEVLFFDATAPLGTHTFRFAVNPSLVDAFPGYVGSRYQPAAKECLIEGGGLFSRCGESLHVGLTEIPGQYTFPPVAPAAPSAGLVAPTLEDVDLFGSPDGALGLDLVSRTYYEVQAADTLVGPLLVEAYLEANRVAFPPRGLEPQNAGTFTETPVRRVSDRMPTTVATGPGAPWVYYLDASRANSAAGSTLTATDAVYLSGVTNMRDAYPGVFRFSALLGLARDENGDGRISLHDAAEWYPLDDFHLPPGGDPTKGGNLADVGTTGLDPETLADAVVAGETLLWNSLCRVSSAGEVRVYAPGSAVPPGDPAIGVCHTTNDGRHVDPAHGWGTFMGTATNRNGLGFYGSPASVIDTTTEHIGTMTSRVSARIQWPTVAEMSALGIVLPQGVDPTSLAGTTVYLTDVDVYQGRI